MVELKDNFAVYKKGALYREYLNLYEEYMRIQDLYMSKPETFDTPPFTNDKISIIVNFIQTKFQIKKPLYKSSELELQKLQKNKLELLHKYDNEKKEIFFKEKKDLVLITKYTQDINNIDILINTITDVMKEYKAHVDTNLNTIRNNNNAIKNARYNLFIDILQTNDDIDKKSKINEYMKMNNTQTPTKKMSDYNLILDNYIENLPILQDNSLFKPDKSENKLKEKLKKAKTNVGKSETRLKTDLKEGIKKIVFKTLDECNSTKRSKPFYMNKAQLHEIIESDPELKKKVGKMFKKMSRVELCDKLLL